MRMEPANKESKKNNHLLSQQDLFQSYAVDTSTRPGMSNMFSKLSEFDIDASSIRARQLEKTKSQAMTPADTHLMQRNRAKSQSNLHHGLKRTQSRNTMKTQLAKPTQLQQFFETNLPVMSHNPHIDKQDFTLRQTHSRNTLKDSAATMKPASKKR